MRRFSPSPRIGHGRVAVVAVALSFWAIGCDDSASAESLDGTELTGIVLSDESDLSGTWMRNPELSDPPPFHRARPDGDGPDGPGPGGIGPGPRGEGDGPAGRRRPGLGGLTITQTAESVTFSHGDRFARTLVTDGQTRTVETPRGRTIQLRAFWEDGALVIERTGEHGTATETWQLSSDGTRIEVAVNATSPEGEPLTWTRVYDRA